MTKLHIGCGKRFLTGFTHVDIEPFPHVDYVSSAHDLRAFSDSSVDLIYTSHTLEYYDFFSVIECLREFSRVLVNNGELFLTVPDFDKLILMYQLHKDIDKIIGPLFGRWVNPSSSNLPIYHKCVFTKEKMFDLLDLCGFKNSEFFNPVTFLKSIDPNYDDYSLAFDPHMDKAGLQVSLAIRTINTK